jgi:C1A family cysteine protease
MLLKFCLFSSLLLFVSARHCLFCSEPWQPSPGGQRTQEILNQKFQKFLFTPKDTENPGFGFSQFIARYGVFYDSDQEFQDRHTAFAQNLKNIQELNNDQINKGGEPVFGMSPFLDFTPEEFRRLYLGLPVHNSTTRTSSITNVRSVQDQDQEQPRPTALSAIDWRNQGAITPVRDQGQCGSCWAHSATEAIESFYFLANHSLPTLSVQMLLGCTYSYDGCEGGWPTDAMQTVINRRGIVGQSSYPYNPNDGVSCKFGTGPVTRRAASISSYTTAPYGTLASVLTNHGPPSICLCSLSLQYYTKGILKSCCNQQDHCVQAIGIGFSTNEQPYWIMRNSWGVAWGEEGYFYLDATVENGNLCGVQEQIDYPII